MADEVHRDDAGLSDARTALAWQRTVLSVIAGCMVLARLTWEVIGPAVIVSMLAAILLCAWTLTQTRARMTSGLPRSAATSRRGGRTAAALTGATLLLAITELASLDLRMTGSQ